MADREVADAVVGSFLAKLPSEVVDELMAEGERTDYPAGALFTEKVQPQREPSLSTA